MAHAQSAYLPSEANEWVFFQELSQVESSYKLKQVSPVGPLPLLLLCGDGPLKVDSGKGKGKGGLSVSLMDGWVKFGCDQQTADQLSRLRSGLHSAFQAFCQK